MSSLALSHLTDFIATYRYLVLFPAALIEGPIATIIAGVLSARGLLNITLSYVVIVISDLIADFGYYAIGRWGHDYVASWFKNSLGLTTERVERLRSYFKQQTWKAFVLGKVLHGPGIAVLVAAGIARVPALDFLIYNALATVVKSLLLILLGYYFGQFLSLFDTSLRYTVIASVVIIIVGVIWTWRAKYRKLTP